MRTIGRGLKWLFWSKSSSKYEVPRFVYEMAATARFGAIVLSIALFALLMLAGIIKTMINEPVQWDTYLAFPLGWFIGGNLVAVFFTLLAKFGEYAIKQEPSPTRLWPKVPYSVETTLFKLALDNQIPKDLFHRILVDLREAGWVVSPNKEIHSHDERFVVPECVACQKAIKEVLS